MFFLCCSLRNLLPPLTVFDLHKVFWIHASLRHIRDGPRIYAATRSTQHFSPFVQPDLATLEGCLLQRDVIPWSTGMSSLKNSRSNEWSRLTGIPAIITGSPLAFIPGSFDLVIPKTTQRVCSVAGRNRQSSRVPPILAQSGYRVNRATRKIGSLYNKHGDACGEHCYCGDCHDSPSQAGTVEPKRVI